MLPLPWRHALRRWLFLPALAALLVSCGGGVDSGGTGSYVAGTITGYGSIVVGGVHYDESSADVRDEFDSPRTRDDLKLGMFTEIQASAIMGSASAPSATAASVRFRSELLGPIDSIDVPNTTLSVLGQTVKVDTGTVFDAGLTGGLGALHATDVIEVYGQFDAQSHAYTATRIEPRIAATFFKLRGPLVSVDSATKTLTIGGSTIDYSGVVALPALRSGQTLRVRLQLVPPAQPGGAWLATTVEVGVTPLPDHDHVEFEGRITAFTSIQAFELDGTPVETDASTQFPDGQAGLVLGARVQVKGSASGGRILASRVELDGNRSPSGYELSGTVAALDTAAQTFTLRGYTIHWSDTTRFGSGKTAAGLQNGRKVEVKGPLSGSGGIREASLIQIDD